MTQNNKSADWIPFPDGRYRVMRAFLSDAAETQAVAIEEMLLEAYTPLQLQYKTGGPPTAAMMVDVQSLTSELISLEFLHLQEQIREVHEGEYHNGTGAVVQALARKP